MKKKPAAKIYQEHHAHSTDCIGCKAFLMDHRPQMPPPIVHTVDRPVEKVVYRDIVPLWVICLIIAGAFAIGWKCAPTSSYPVYINRIDPSVQAKLSDCQSDWQADQVTKRLLNLKIKRLEMP